MSPFGGRLVPAQNEVLPRPTFFGREGTLLLASINPGRLFFAGCMHTLYADESGHAGGLNQSCFILAGVSVFESHARGLAGELNAIAARFNPADPRKVELHGSPMATGNKKWRKHPRADRQQAMKDALRVLAQSHPDNRLFVAVADPAAADVPPVEYAFMQLATQFDRYLARLHHNDGNQRGMMLFDKSAHEKKIQSLAAAAYRNDELNNLAEVPAFMDSRASRLIQLADLAAYAVNRRMHGDDGLFDIIQPRLDGDAGELHGLHSRATKGKKQ